MRLISAILLTMLVVGCNAFDGESAEPGPRVYFISPKDGAEIEGSVHVVMGLSGMGVAPAGVEMENTGHHHLIINAATPPAGVPLPNDAQHRHFGGGQTEAMVELAPGQHSLQLVLGDHAHRPHDPVIASEVITITVK